MNKARQHFLAGSAFSHDHNAGIGLRHFFGKLKQLTGFHILRHRLRLIRCRTNVFFHHCHQLLCREWFFQIIHRPITNGFHRIGDAAIGCHNQHRQLGPLSSDLTHQLVSVHSRHVDIGDHQLTAIVSQPIQRRFRIRYTFGIEAAHFQGIHNGFTQIGIIFHHQYVCCIHLLCLLGILSITLYQR